MIPTGLQLFTIVTVYSGVFVYSLCIYRFSTLERWWNWLNMKQSYTTGMMGPLYNRAWSTHPNLGKGFCDLDAQV